MLKNLSVLEVKVDDRLYRFECDPNAPLGEVYDSVSAMKKYIYGVMKERYEKEQAEEKAVEEAKKEAKQECKEACKKEEEDEQKS